MQMKRRRDNHTERGFSFVEILVSLTIVGTLAAVATPNMRGLSRNYYLKSAASMLYSHLQMAKLGAVKDNSAWTVAFNPGTLIGYEVRNNAGRVIKQVDFRSAYGGNMQFRNPTGGDIFDAATLTFSPNGLSTTGFAYLSTTEQSSYYRVGVPLVNGLARVQKWNGSAWQ